MGDRCYVEVTCRAEDAARFIEELEFNDEFESNLPGCVRVSDDQADYGHSGKLPTDIPYFGISGAGGNYDAQAFACDGQTFVEVPTLDHADAFGVPFVNGEPDPQAIQAVKEYLRIEEAAHKAMAGQLQEA